MKLKCGEAAKRSATRLPISLGEPPLGQFLKSVCAAAFGMSDNVKAKTAKIKVGRGLINFLLLCNRVRRKDEGGRMKDEGIADRSTFILPPSSFILPERVILTATSSEFDRQSLALLDEVRLR